MPSINKRIVVGEGGERLDIFLVRHLDAGITRSRLNNNIKAGEIKLNGKETKSGAILRAGDVIDIDIAEDSLQAVPEDIKLDIVYEDKYLIIINKPRGMVVHPGAGNRQGTLLNGLLFRAGASREQDTPDKDEQPPERAGIVHRLDKNTAGLMVAALTAETSARLSEMFAKHEIKRTYIGLVEGRLEGDGVIDRNIARDPNRRTLFKTVEKRGRQAVTRYKVLENLGAGNQVGVQGKRGVAMKWSLVQFNLETGRTHQIRVHCKAIGHPLIGDIEYNPNSSIKTDGQLLESVEIEFVHPITDKLIREKIGLSDKFRGILAQIKPN